MARPEAQPGAASPGESGGREAFVDTRAIARNLLTLREAAGMPRVLAVVTGDAFGHGAVPVALAALEAGAEALVVARLAEAEPLRMAGITAPIVTWQHAADEDFVEAVRLDVTPAVNSVALARAAAAAGVRAVQLVPEIGGEQLGIPDDAWPSLCAELAEREHAGGPSVTGIMATVPERDDAAFARIDAAVARARETGLRPELVHVCEYEPARGLEHDAASAVRLGAALYGLSAYEAHVGRHAAAHPLHDVAALEPALTLTAPVLGLKHAPAGVGVSYGYTHVTERPTTLALVPLGYGDGIPRRSGNHTRAGIGGVNSPIIGRVAMDALVVDAGAAAEAGSATVSIGEPAQLIGSPDAGAWSAEDWAAALQTSSLDIVARLTTRVRRVIA
ncbi:alanine racemase [Microbacterium sp. STN6]|uniref:alanine racemase n=1 Tax=Microbacterium sp. STN6 TaxID=2995588 RepID=UPI00226086FF|nr:alanine racemase [Microbacterium sp. STN6]MCX7522433.1 alanine racemase [Microbacterium sp. STN6]